MKVEEMNTKATLRYPGKDRPWLQATNTLRIWKQIWQKQNWASVAADRAGRVAGLTYTDTLYLKALNYVLSALTL